MPNYIINDSQDVIIIKIDYSGRRPKKVEVIKGVKACPFQRLAARIRVRFTYTEPPTKPILLQPGTGIARISQDFRLHRGHDTLELRNPRRERRWSCRARSGLGFILKMR